MKVLEVAPRLKYENAVLKDILEMNDLDFAYEDGSHFIFADLQTPRLLTNLVNVNFKGQKAYVFNTFINEKVEKVFKIGELNFCAKDLYDIYQVDEVQVKIGSFYDDKQFIDEDDYFQVLKEEEEIVSGDKIDNLFKLTRQTRVERKHKIYIKKEDPEYFHLLKMGNLDIPILDAANNFMVFFEHPIQLEPIEEKGIVKFVSCKNTRFTQYRVDVVRNLNKVHVDDQLQKMDNFYGASILFAIKNDDEKEKESGLDVVLLGYNTLKINPIMCSSVNSKNLYKYIGDMVLFGTYFYQNFRLTDYGITLKNENIDKNKIIKFLQDLQVSDAGDYDEIIPKYEFKMDKQYINFQIRDNGVINLVNIPVKINSDEEFVFLTNCFGATFIIGENGDLIPQGINKKNSMERIIGLIDSHKIQNFVLKQDFDFVNVFQKRIPNFNDICFYPIDSKIHIRDLSTYIKIAIPFVRLKQNVYVKLSSQKWLDKMIQFFQLFYVDGIIGDMSPMISKFVRDFRPPNFKPFKTNYNICGKAVPCIKLTQGNKGKCKILLLGSVDNILDVDVIDLMGVM